MSGRGRSGYIALRSSRARPLVILIPLLASCYGTRHIPFNGSTGLENTTGVTLRSGAEIVFVTTGATIANDTLHAITRHDHIAIPTDSIAEISVRKLSPLRTGALVVGVTAATALALLFAFVSALGSIN